jgi:hypothetical protein
VFHNRDLAVSVPPPKLEGDTNHAQVAGSSFAGLQNGKWWWMDSNHEATLPTVTDVKRAFWNVLIARATYGPGTIPHNVLVPARKAENHFADVARRSLGLDVELFAEMSS